MWNHIQWYAGVWLIASSKWCYDKLQERAPSINEGSSLPLTLPLVVVAVVLLGLRWLGRCITGFQVGNQHRMDYLDRAFHD